MIPQQDAKRTDRWGLPRPRRGILRGQIRNITRGADVCDFGELIICDFELVIDENTPPVAVRMTGTNFNRDVPDERIADVRDTGARPIIANRLILPPNDEEIVAYYPGRADPSDSVMRLRGLLMVTGPVVFALALLGLFLLFFG